MLRAKDIVKVYLIDTDNEELSFLNDMVRVEDACRVISYLILGILDFPYSINFIKVELIKRGVNKKILEDFSRIKGKKLL